jgi:hypothetical protein
MEIFAASPYNNPILDRVVIPLVEVAADPFSRADTAYPPSGSSLGSTPVGNKSWDRAQSASASQFGGIIQSGRLGLVASGSTRVALTVETAKADGVLSTKFDSGIKDNTIALVARYVDINNFLFVTCSGSRWSLFRRVAGAGQAINVPSLTPQAANGDILELYLEGPSVRLEVNGNVAIQTQTVNDFVTATRHGYAKTVSGTLSTPAEFWDDFSFKSAA